MLGVLSGSATLINCHSALVLFLAAEKRHVSLFPALWWRDITGKELKMSWRDEDPPGWTHPQARRDRSSCSGSSFILCCYRVKWSPDRSLKNIDQLEVWAKHRTSGGQHCSCSPDSGSCVSASSCQSATWNKDEMWNINLEIRTKCVVKAPGSKVRWSCVC